MRGKRLTMDTCEVRSLELVILKRSFAVIHTFDSPRKLSNKVCRAFDKTFQLRRLIWISDPYHSLPLRPYASRVTVRLDEPNQILYSCRSIFHPYFLRLPESFQATSAKMCDVMRQKLGFLRVGCIFFSFLQSGADL